MGLFGSLFKAIGTTLSVTTEVLKEVNKGLQKMNDDVEERLDCYKRYKHQQDILSLAQRVDTQVNLSIEIINMLQRYYGTSSLSRTLNTLGIQLSLSDIDINATIAHLINNTVLLDLNPTYAFLQERARVTSSDQYSFEHGFVTRLLDETACYKDTQLRQLLQFTSLNCQKPAFTTTNDLQVVNQLIDNHFRAMIVALDTLEEISP